MNIIKFLIKKISFYYWRYIKSSEAYARHLGVTIGNNCFIGTRGWSKEPYLVTIGNNVQITRCVSIHTHGGAIPSEKNIQILMCLGKSL